jgi:hypothetical protein
LAEAVPGPTDLASPVVGQLPELLQGIPQQLLPVWWQRFHPLHAVEHLLTLLRRQTVELFEPLL